LTEALRLPPNARASVAGSLILSLETDPDAGVEGAWAAEVDRRLAAFPQDTKRAVAWSTVRAQIARRRRV